MLGVGLNFVLEIYETAKIYLNVMMMSPDIIMYRDHLAAKVAPTMFDENSFSFFCRRHVTWQDVKWVSEAFSDGFGDAGLHVRAQRGDQMPKGVYIYT